MKEYHMLGGTVVTAIHYLNYALKTCRILRMLSLKPCWLGVIYIQVSFLFHLLFLLFLYNLLNQCVSTNINQWIHWSFEKQIQDLFWIWLLQHMKMEYLHRALIVVLVQMPLFTQKCDFNLIARAEHLSQRNMEFSNWSNFVQVLENICQISLEVAFTY